MPSSRMRTPTRFSTGHKPSARGSSRSGNAVRQQAGAHRAFALHPAQRGPKTGGHADGPPDAAVIESGGHGNLGLEKIASIDEDRIRHHARQLWQIELAKLAPFR